MINVTGDIMMEGDVGGDRIVVGDVTNSVLNIKGSMENLAQNFASAAVDEAAKRELAALVAQLKFVIEGAAKLQPEAAGAVNDAVATLSDRVGSATPNRTSIRAALAAVADAAKDIADAVPVVKKLADAAARAFGLAA